ncbi:MAG: hypothetical protein HZB56_22890 [Deltaproteobacteria bacterium]|nr:hypothetical protein [Deltaproteobacteria bacterium]
MFRSLAVAVLSLAAFLPASARAHCDTLDGPVVVSARKALESGKLNPVLAWVRPGDEPEIKAAFTRARSVRRLGPEARELADTSFFETLVRVHRAGEGAPYTGLKAAGQDLGPAVPAADRAIASRSPAEVEQLLVETVKKGLHRRLAQVNARAAPGEDVAAGREWVEAYVPYVHWVEGVYGAAAGPVAHSGPAPAKHPHGGADSHGHGEAPAAGHAEPRGHAKH